MTWKIELNSNNHTRFLVLGLVASVLCACSNSSGNAAAPTESIVLNKGVVLNHTTHAEQACESCHQCGVADGKTTMLRKDWAHFTCKGCHADKLKGPTNCKGCHTLNPTAKAVLSNTATISLNGTLGNLVVTATDFSGVAGVDLAINYDSSCFSSPVVISGELLSGFLVATNTATPGRVKVAAITSQPVTGSGMIVSVSFMGVRDCSSSLAASVNTTLSTISANGQSLPTQTTVAPYLNLSGATIVSTSPSSPVSQIVTTVAPTPSTTTPEITFSCK